MVTRSVATKLLKVYGRAWEGRDPELILTIFAKDAVYKERAYSKHYSGLAGVKKYWTSKVVGEQRDIHFKLLNLFIDGDTVIAEWEARFYDTKRGIHIRFKEAAIMTIRNNKIKELREYWSSKHY